MLLFLNGRELRIILRQRKMSQKDLANRAGLTEVYISRLMKQHQSIGLEAQKKIQAVIKFVPFERMFTSTI